MSDDARYAPAPTIVPVVAGKGGVGKSTVSLSLALAFSRHGRVGLLDADVTGPNIPRMLNLRRQHRRKEWRLWTMGANAAPRLPALEVLGLEVMSSGFLLGEDQALDWPAQMIGSVVEQLLLSVDWGDLDFLVVDLPPGTGDVLQRTLELLAVTYAVLVVGPDDVSHLDTRRVLETLREARVPVAGAVENMTHVRCASCGHDVRLAPPVSADRAVWADGVARLASIPLDLDLAAGAHRGHPLIAQDPEHPISQVFTGLADRLAGHPPRAA